MWDARLTGGEIRSSKGAIHISFNLYFAYINCIQIVLSFKFLVEINTYSENLRYNFENRTTLKSLSIIKFPFSSLNLEKTSKEATTSEIKLEYIFGLIMKFYMKSTPIFNILN